MPGPRLIASVCLLCQADPGGGTFVLAIVLDNMVGGSS